MNEFFDYQNIFGTMCVGYNIIQSWHVSKNVILNNCAAKFGPFQSKTGIEKPSLITKSKTGIQKMWKIQFSSCLHSVNFKTFNMEVTIA